MGPGGAVAKSFPSSNLANILRTFPNSSVVFQVVLPPPSIALSTACARVGLWDLSSCVVVHSMTCGMYRIEVTATT